MSNQCADVVIAGGGVMGNATAYYLRKKGCSVIVLEEEMLGNGGSSRNGGGVRQSGRDNRELPLAIYGIGNIWPHLSEELGVDIEYHQAGNIKFAKDERGVEFYKKVVEQNLKKGLELRMLNQAETREICPLVSDEIIASCYCPSDGHANALMTTLAFYKRARELGARFITGEKVLSVKLHKGRAKGVITSRGNVYEGDKIIITAGYESRAILNSVHIDVPMRRKLIEVIIIEMQPKIFPMMITIPDYDGGGYGHQTDHGSFVFGGHIPLENYLRPEEKEVTQLITTASNCNQLVSYFPYFKDAKVIRSWSGWTDLCQDEVPVIGNIDEVPGLLTACGFTGHGFGISPAVAACLSELAVDKEPSVDISGLSYSRFIM